MAGQNQKYHQLSGEMAGQNQKCHHVNCSRVWFMMTLDLLTRISHSLSCLLTTRCVLVTHLSVQSELPPEQHTVPVSNVAVQFQTLWVRSSDRDVYR